MHTECAPPWCSATRRDNNDNDCSVQCDCLIQFVASTAEWSITGVAQKNRRNKRLINATITTRPRHDSGR
jgi:hypothetical protein